MTVWNAAVLLVSRLVGVMQKLSYESCECTESLIWSLKNNFITSGNKSFSDRIILLKTQRNNDVDASLLICGTDTDYINLKHLFQCMLGTVLCFDIECLQTAGLDVQKKDK